MAGEGTRRRPRSTTQVILAAEAACCGRRQIDKIATSTRLLLTSRRTAASLRGPDIFVDSNAKSRELLRQRVFQILEHGRRREPASRAIDWILILLIIGNVAATVAQTAPEIALRHGVGLQIFDRSCLLAFALEYLARI